MVTQFFLNQQEKIYEDSIHGEWMGIIKISSAIFPTVRKEVESLSKLENFDSMKMHHLLEHLLVGLKQPIRVVYTTGNWLDVDTLEDVIRANNFL